MTSTEAEEIQAITKANGKGKIKFDSIEEPPPRASSPRNAIREANAAAPRTGPEAARRIETSLLDRAFNIIKNTVRDEEEILRKCIKLIATTCGTSLHPGADPLASHRQRLLGMLKKCLKLQLDEEILSAKVGTIHNPTESLKMAREDIFGEMLDLALDQQQLNGLQQAIAGRTSGAKSRTVQELTREQEVELESLVSIIGQPIARALPFLASNNWNLDDAISAYYQSLDDEYPDSDEFDEEEIATAIKNSQGDLLKDEYFSTSPGGLDTGSSQSSKSEWMPNPTQAGSSGVKNQSKLTEEQEALELQAARDKLDRLIREERQHGRGGNTSTGEGHTSGREEQEDDSDEYFGATVELIAHQKATNPELMAIQARIAKMQQTNADVEKRKQSFSPKLTEFLRQNQSSTSTSKAVETIRESVERDGETRTNRPSLQTALDVINRKKRVSSAHHDDGSPTKKQREGTLWEAPHPHSETTMADRPPAGDTADEPLDFDTKHAILVSMGLCDEELCRQQLLKNEGDLERTKIQLHIPAYLHKLDTGELEVPDEGSQDKGKGVGAQRDDVFQTANNLSVLRSMHLASDQRCLEALQVTRGDLSRAIGILRMEAAAATRGPPPPLSPPPRQLPPRSHQNLDFFDLNQANPATLWQPGESNIQQPRDDLGQVQDKWQRTLDILKGNLATTQRQLTPSPPPVSEESLATLHAMGFYDRERNREMLDACGGDVGMAVEELLKPSSDSGEEGASVQQTASVERKKETGIHLGGWDNWSRGDEGMTNSFPPMQDTRVHPELKYEGKGKGRAVEVEFSASSGLDSQSTAATCKDERKDSKNDEQSQIRHEEDVEMRSSGVDKLEEGSDVDAEGEDDDDVMDFCE